MVTEVRALIPLLPVAIIQVLHRTEDPWDQASRPLTTVLHRDPAVTDLPLLEAIPLRQVPAVIRRQLVAIRGLNLQGEKVTRLHRGDPIRMGPLCQIATRQLQISPEERRRHRKARIT